MPSIKHSKKSSAEERRIAELEKLIADQSKTISNLEKNIQEAKKVIPVNNLIPKPRGQAGRGNGYMLLAELKLPKSRGRRILRIIRVLASQGLDPTKSFREQDKERMKAVITKTVAKVPVMKYYHGYWPVLAIIKQYLTNAKKRLTRDLNAEEQDRGIPGSDETREKAKERKRAISDKAKMRHVVLSDSDIEDDKIDSDDSEYKGASDEDNDDSDGDGGDTEDDRAALEMYEHYKGSLECDANADRDGDRHSKKSDSNHEQIHPGKSVSVAKGKEKQGVKPVLKSAKGNKRKATAKRPAKELPDVESSAKPPKRTKIDQTVITSEVQCPMEGCTDMLPGSPSDGLKAKLKNLLRIQQGKEKGTPHFLSALICEAIKKELRFPMLKELGKSSGWPSAINFEAIPERIMNLKNEIRALLTNEIVLGTSFAWRVFVNDITRKDVNMSFADFAASSEAVRLVVAGEGDNKHAGYFGPMGESVILSTLYRLFPDTLADTAELASTLQSLYESETSECEAGDVLQRFWEGSKADHCTITLRDFLIYLVVPEAAVLLIADDLHISNARANQARVQSKEYGKAFYSTVDDGRIDDITNRNVRALRGESLASKIPPRMKRKELNFLPPLVETLVTPSVDPDVENLAPPVNVVALSEAHPSGGLNGKPDGACSMPRTATPGPGPNTMANRIAKSCKTLKLTSSQATRRSTRRIQK